MRIPPRPLPSAEDSLTGSRCLWQAGQKGCVATAEICVALQHKLMQGKR